MLHLTLFQSPWEYLNHVTRSETTKFNKEGVLTILDKQSLLHESIKSPYIFFHIMYLSQLNGHCFGVWPRVSRTSQNSMTALSVHVHIASSSLQAPFPECAVFI